MKRLTSEQKEFLLLNKDETSRQLAEETGIPASTIRAFLKRMGVRKRVYFTPDKKEFIKNYDELKSSRKMAEIYSVDHVTIQNYAKKIGYDISRYSRQIEYLSDEEKRYIIDNYHLKSSTELAEEFECSGSLISSIWMDAGLKGKIKRTYYYNEDYFEEINSLDKAYFLGLLVADGCLFSRVNKNSTTYITRIALVKDDAPILESFSKYIGTNKPLSYYKRKNDGREYVSMEVVGEKFYKDLVKLGLHERKTWTYLPVQIRDDLISHYLRGVFDGDGNVSVTEKKGRIALSQTAVSFCGHYEFMKIIHEYLTKLGIKSTLSEDRRSYSGKFGIVIMPNMTSKYSLLKLMYKNSEGIRLDRKFQKALSFIKAVENVESTRKKNSVEAIEFYKNNLC